MILVPAQKAGAEDPKRSVGCNWFAIRGVVMASENQRSINIDLRVWYDEGDGQIHVASKDRFISTISLRANSERRHRHLFRKLAEQLRAEGRPAPPET